MSGSGVVITGIGLVTSLGRSPEETFAAIAAGRTGLGPMPALEQRPVPDKGGGQAVELPAGYCVQLPRAARYLRFAVEQALMACTDVLPPRVAAVVGTTLHGMRAGGEYLRKGDARLLAEFLPGRVLHAAVDGLGIGGPLLTTCSACSSGLGSVALGATLLRAKAADRVIAGGYDSVSEYAYAGFDSLRLVADGPPRPFGADRDGMKVAEGYGAIVLERADDAAARGATVLAELAGCGESSDSFHLTQPRPDGSGAASAIRAALAESGLSAVDIGLISAHATATPDNDAAEYAALSAALGTSLRDISVVAFKSCLGHTLGGAGAVELILTLQALIAGAVPPTAGTGPTDPAFTDLRLVRGTPVPRRMASSLNLSLGFGGANTSVVLRRGTQARNGISKDRHNPVITGIGLVLPGAATMPELAALLRAGRPRDTDSGPVAEASYAGVLQARRTRRMSDYSKLSLAAALRACADAGVAGDPAFLAGCSAVLGTTHGASPFCEEFYGQIVREGLGAANPVLFAEGVPNAAAAHLSMALGIRGGCQTIIGTRTAGLDALALAALRIRNGEWPSAIVSAAEEYSAVVNSAYAACGLYGGSSGLFTGAGAVAIVLEQESLARSRGAPVWGVVGDIDWNHRDGQAQVIWTALTPVHGDRAVRSASAGVVRTVYGPLPELFSVGPLAAVAAALSVERDPCAVLAAAFDGRSVCVGLEPGGRAAIPG